MNKNNNVNWSNCYILVNDEAYRQYFDATGKAPEDIENILLGTGGCIRLVMHVTMPQILEDAATN